MAVRRMANSVTLIRKLMAHRKSPESGHSTYVASGRFWPEAAPRLVAGEWLLSGKADAQIGEFWKRSSERLVFAQW
jgi:hypothetical protein